MEKIVHTINYTGMSCGHEWLPQSLKSTFYDFFFCTPKIAEQQLEEKNNQKFVDSRLRGKIAASLNCILFGGFQK